MNFSDKKREAQRTTEMYYRAYDNHKIILKM